MKITCEDNRGCYRCSRGENKALKNSGLFGILHAALTGPKPVWWLCQGYVLSKRTNCFQLCLGRPNKIERYTVDFQLYNQVFFLPHRNLNILFRLLSCLSFPKIPRNFVRVENGLDINIFLAGNFLVRIIKTLGLPCDVHLFLQRFRKNEKNSYSVHTIRWNFHCSVKVIQLDCRDLPLQ